MKHYYENNTTFIWYAFLSPLLSVCVKTTVIFPWMFTHIWSMLHVIMGWNQIRKNYWNDKHGLSIAWRDIDVFFLCNFEAHTWDWRTERCYLHNNIVSNSLKKPAIISLPPASAKSNFQSQILFLFITYQMLNQVNCVNFTFLFIYLFLCFLWLSFGTERLYKIWGLSNFQRSAILTSFGNTSLTTAPARERQRGNGSDAFWKWFMRSKINNVAWSACKVQPLNGSVAD